MLKSSLRNCSNAYIHVKGTKIIPNTATAAAAAAAATCRKKYIFKNCAPFTDCISEINNTQLDNAKGTDIVRPMDDLIK